MIGWLARMALLRVLPRKLVPILTVIEVARLLRSARNQQRVRAAEQNAAAARTRARWVGESGPTTTTAGHVDAGRTSTGA